MHVPIHGMPRLQWFSIRGVSREHIRMAFSLVAPAATDSRELLFRRLNSTSSHDFGGRLPSRCHSCHPLNNPPSVALLSHRHGKSVERLNALALDKRDVRNLVNNGTDCSVIAYLNSEVSRAPKSCRFK